MINKDLAAISAVILFVILSGCRVNVDVPPGGRVVSTSGAFDCAQDAPCDVDILDTNFDDTFTAEPDEGFTFVRWKTAALHFCGGADTPCRLTTLIFAGNEAFESFLVDTTIEFFLVPVFGFESSGVPITWTGEWETTNSLQPLTGDILLGVEDQGDGTSIITLGLGGLIGGLIDPPPQTVVATQQENGDLSFSGDIDLAGD